MCCNHSNAERTRAPDRPMEGLLSLIVQIHSDTAYSEYINFMYIELFVIDSAAGRLQGRFIHALFLYCIPNITFKQVFKQNNIVKCQARTIPQTLVVTGLRIYFYAHFLTSFDDGMQLLFCRNTRLRFTISDSKMSGTSRHDHL